MCICIHVYFFRFLANRFGLDGKTDIEQAKANSIIDQLNDLYFYYAQAYYRTEDKESKEREVEKLTRTKLPAYYRSIENMIEESSTVYCIGDKITYADLAIACTVDRDQLNEMIQLNDTFLEAYPNIKRVFENVNNQPKIAEWRKTRNSTWF
jgi:glutathione S-transferase